MRDISKEVKPAKAALSTVRDAGQLAGGLLMLLFAIISAMIYYHGIPVLFDTLKAPGTEVSAGYIGSMFLFLFSYIPLLLFFVSLGLLYLVKSLRSLLIPELPTLGSQPFRDYEEFRRGLQEHLLSGYGTLGAFVSTVFGKRTMYLPPSRKKIVQCNGEKLKWRVIWILLAAACILYVHLVAKDSPEPNYGLVVPFVWLIGLQIVMGLVDFSSCMLLVPQDEPRTESHEALEFYKGFGNPTHLFSRLPDLGEALRSGDRPNRTYVVKGEKASVSVSDVGEFGGTFYIERQPQAIDSGRREAAYVLLAAGWMLRLLGCFLFLFRLLPAELRDLAAGGPGGRILPASLIFVLGMLLAAASAWRSGRRYSRQAADLILSARFRSVGILIGVTGEVARADIRVGKAVMDSMESSNVSARSNFTARFWAAELISEAGNPAEARELLALNRTGESLLWIDHFRQGIYRLRDERVTPAGIDLDSEEVREISGANLGHFADRARVLQGSPPAPQIAASHIQALTDGEIPFTDGEEGKACPECAEIVRLKARKCRYCGHQFRPA